MKHISPSVFVRVTLLTLLLVVLCVANTFSLVPRARATTQNCGSWHVYPSPPQPMYGGLYGVPSVPIPTSGRWEQDISLQKRSLPSTQGLSNVGMGWAGILSLARSQRITATTCVLYRLSASDAWAVGSDQMPKMASRTTADAHRALERQSLERGFQPKSARFPQFALRCRCALCHRCLGRGREFPARGTVPTKTFVEHWNGSSWSIVASPSPKDGGAFSAVTAFAPNDIWAVGTQFSQFNFGPSLIEHWNGQKWSIIPSPTAGFASEFRSVSGSSPNSIWAVGDYIANGGYYDLAEYWNGSTWSIVPVAKFPKGSGDLGGVLALRSNDVWAVGGSDFGGGIFPLGWATMAWLRQPRRREFPVYCRGPQHATIFWAVGGVIMHFCHA